MPGLDQKSLFYLFPPFIFFFFSVESMIKSVCVGVGDRMVFISSGVLLTEAVNTLIGNSNNTDKKPFRRKASLVNIFDMSYDAT